MSEDEGSSSEDEHFDLFLALVTGASDLQLPDELEAAGRDLGGDSGLDGLSSEDESFPEDKVSPSEHGQITAASVFTL